MLDQEQRHTNAAVSPSKNAQQRLVCRKAHWTSVVFASLAVALGLLFNLPFQYDDLVAGWTKESSVEFHWFSQLSERKWVHGGFPLTYYSTFVGQDRDKEVVWFASNLAFNVLALTLVAGAVYFITRWRYQVTIRRGMSRRQQIICDSLIIIAALLPISIGLTQRYFETERHFQVAKNIGQHGTCFIGCRVPSILRSRLPGVTRYFFTRIRIVNLISPSNELLHEVVHLDTLVGLRVLGGSVRAEHLDQLRSKRLFNLLHLDNAKLTLADIGAISRLENLEELSFARTNLDGVLLRPLDRLQKIKVMNLVQTPLRLSDLGEPDWKWSVRQLYLPRRANDEPDRVEIDRWPLLHTMGITDPSTRLSTTAIRMEISNCDKLQRLVIDRVQKYEFIAKNLPRFQSISEEVDQISFVGTSVDGLPRQTWFAEVDIQGLPSLQFLGVFANDLDTIRILNCSSLTQLSLSEGILVSGSASTAPTRRIDRTQRIVDDLAKCEGPATVEFEGFDFSDVRLQPLTQNPRIKHLRFLDSVIVFPQLQELAGLAHLRTLSAETCQATSTDLEWLLQKFPKLEMLDLDIGNVDELTLSQRPGLTSFSARPLRRVKRVFLEGVPKLDMQIHVSCPIRDLEVINAPQLTGLGLEGPWPAEAKISGLRDLRWFAAGGPSVDDSVLDAVLLCQSLDRLMLAYPSISRDSLKKIGGFLELTSLVLPGADVDDDVTKSYRKLNLIREANFSDSRVDVGTVQWLLGVESMRRLSVNRVALSAAALEKLAGMTQLNELEIAGVAISDELFEAILSEHELEHLNFSNHQVTTAQFNALLRNTSLRLLDLAGCDLAPAKIQQLLDENPELLITVDEEISAAGNAADAPVNPQRASDRIVNRDFYQKTRLLLGNYGIPHTAALRSSYFLASSVIDLEKALFGWFDPTDFRTTNLRP